MTLYWMQSLEKQELLNECKRKKMRMRFTP